MLGIDRNIDFLSLYRVKQGALLSLLQSGDDLLGICLNLGERNFHEIVRIIEVILDQFFKRVLLPIGNVL